MRVRDLFLRNLPVKLLSLFFALVLWGVVIGERKAQVQLNIPLELVNMPEEAVLVTDVPANISVVVRGPRTLIRSLPGRGVTKSIDLKELGIGWTAIRIPPDSIYVPRGIEVLRVTPSTIDLKLEPVVEVRLPVAVQLDGEPESGYKVLDVTVDPTRVVLRGGSSELSGVRDVRTFPVSIAQTKKDLEEHVGLELDGLHLVEVSPISVWVKVRVAPILEERALNGIPVRAKPSGIQLSVSPDTVDIRVKGPIAIVRNLKPDDVRATVEAKGLKSGTHQIGPKVNAPDGVRVLDVKPSVVTVELKSTNQQQQKPD